jgi:ATP-dependent exoDNAse (exonuclease V) alpha subunit
MKPENPGPAPHIDLNPAFKRALEAMETGARSIFITGRAGTGKSTLLEYFRGITGKKVAVLAPTGVAALNVHGQTIHSFFGFKPDVTLEKVKKRRSSSMPSVYQQLDAVIIDEVSMVRADLLDCVDKFLRLNGPKIGEPFGGIQMIFIGDLYQLPPVINSTERGSYDELYRTPYFYGARVFGEFDMDFIELEKVYRQQDEKFVRLLNAVRDNSADEEDLESLNRRYKPDFIPAPGDFYIYLTTTNAMARQINDAELAKLDEESFVFEAEVSGKFGNEYIPNAPELQVKVGAQIMMLNNDSAGRWVNGSIGRITAILPRGSETVIQAELDEGRLVEIKPFTWNIYRFFADEGGLQSEVMGSFKQYPLMPAWAVTIHKSQGKTFDRVIIDMGRGAFACGQTYVALSRCTTLEGIVLKTPILKRHILMDESIEDYMGPLTRKK